MEDGRGAYKSMVEKPERKGTDHLEHPGVDCRIIMKWIFKKWDGEA
jgi:hypothetical protein